MCARLWIFPVIVACGGPPAATAHHDEECQQLVSRYDLTDTQLKTAERGATEGDLKATTESFRSTLPILASAEKDFTAFHPSDPALAQLATDTATMAHTAREALSKVTSGFERLQGFVEEAKPLVAHFEKVVDALSDACKAPSPDCKTAWSFVAKLKDPNAKDILASAPISQIVNPTIRALLTQVVSGFKALLDHDVKVDALKADIKKNLGTIGDDHLDERYHALCGRPIQSKPSPGT